MLGTVEVRERLKPGTILQVNPAANLAEGNGCLVVVTAVRSWGVDAMVNGRAEKIIPIAWQHVEETGGAVVWDASGGRVKEAPPTVRHHP